MKNKPFFQITTIIFLLFFLLIGIRGSAQEKEGEEKGSVLPIRLKLSGIDLFEIKKGKEKGAKIDNRIAIALNYLLEPDGEKMARHEYIKATILKGYYSNRRAESRESIFPQGEDPNESAHHRGQAADIYEIDYLKCSKIRKINGVSIKRKKKPIPIEVRWQLPEGLEQSRRQSNATLANISSVQDGANKIPVGGVWQELNYRDLPRSLNLPTGFDFSGVATATGAIELAKGLGLPDYSLLDMATSPGWQNQNFAYAALAKVFNIQDPGALANAKDPTGIVFNVIASRTEENLNLPRGSFYLFPSKKEVLGRIGQGRVHELFAIPQDTDLNSGEAKKTVNDTIASYGEGASADIGLNLPADVVAGLKAGSPDYPIIGAITLSQHLGFSPSEREAVVNRYKNNQPLGLTLKKTNLDFNLTDEELNALTGEGDRQVVIRNHQAAIESLANANLDSALPQDVRATMGEVLGLGGQNLTYQNLKDLYGSSTARTRFAAQAGNQLLLGAVDAPLPDAAIDILTSPNLSWEEKKSRLNPYLTPEVLSILSQNLELPLGLPGLGISVDDLIAFSQMPRATSEEKRARNDFLTKLALGPIGEQLGVPAANVYYMVNDKKVDWRLGAEVLTQGLGVSLATGNPTIDNVVQQIEESGFDLNRLRDPTVVADIIGIDPAIAANIPANDLIEAIKNHDDNKLTAALKTTGANFVSGVYGIPFNMVDSLFSLPQDKEGRKTVEKNFLAFFAPQLGIPNGVEGLINIYLNGQTGKDRQAALAGEIVKELGIPDIYTNTDAWGFVNGDLARAVNTAGAAEVNKEYGPLMNLKNSYDLIRVAFFSDALEASQSKGAFEDYLKGRYRASGMSKEEADKGVIEATKDAQKELRKELGVNVLEAALLKNNPQLPPGILRVAMLGTDEQKINAVAQLVNNKIGLDLPPELTDLLSGYAKGKISFSEIGGQIGAIDEALDAGFDQWWNVQKGTFGEFRGALGDLDFSNLSEREILGMAGNLYQGDVFGLLTNLGQTLGVDIGPLVGLAQSIFSGNFDWVNLAQTILSYGFGLPVTYKEKTLCAADYYPEIDTPAGGEENKPFDGEDEVSMAAGKMKVAKMKVKQVMRDLLGMAKELKDENQTPTQLWTFSKKDVDEYGETIKRIYGYNPAKGENPPMKQGVWANVLASHYIHLGY